MVIQPSPNPELKPCDIPVGNVVQPKRFRPTPKSVMLFLVLVALITASQIVELPMDKIRETLGWVQANFGWKAAILGALIYAILLAIPFFPGVELGWLIILFYGREAVVLIYLFTLVGLIFSFSCGRWIGLICEPCKLKMDHFGNLYNESYLKLSERIHGLFSKKQCSLFVNQLLKKSHYLVLAILINIPGNSLVGGGGGIALLSGMNRSVSFKGFVLTVVLAVSPLPILLFFGLVQVEKLLM